MQVRRSRVHLCCPSSFLLVKIQGHLAVPDGVVPIVLCHHRDPPWSDCQDGQHQGRQQGGCCEPAALPIR